EPWQIAVGGPDNDLALDGEPARGGPVEVAAVQADGRRFIWGERGRLRLELEVEALGREVFDQKRCLRERRRGWVGQHVDAPGARHRRGRELQGRRVTAQALIGKRFAALFDAV